MRLIFLAAATLFFCLSASAKPCVLIMHGFMASDAVHSPSRSALTRKLMDQGLDVIIAKTQRVADIAEQVALLDEELQTALADYCTSLALIGHSQGGLVSRYFVHHSKHKDKVFSVITVGSPHHGPIENQSAVARYLRMAVEFISKTNWWFRDSVENFLRVGDQMNPEFMSKVFNKEIYDVDAVDYLSVASVSDMRRAALYPLVSGPIEVQNPFDDEISDGLVGVRGAMWSKMLYADGSVKTVTKNRRIRGPLFHADHFSQIVDVPHGSYLYYPSAEIADKIVGYLMPLIQKRQCQELL